MIVVGGEALVDLVPAEPGGALAPLVPTLGGGPYNAALAASRLGAPCSFLSRISVDAFGDALLLRLRESDVGTDLVQRGPEPTSRAVVALACDGSARYSFYTDGTADRLVRDPGALPESAWHSALGFAPERRRSPSHAGAPNRRPWRRWAPSDTGWHAGSHPRWCASPRVGGARHANSGVGLL